MRPPPTPTPNPLASLLLPQLRVDSGTPFQLKDDKKGGCGASIHRVTDSMLSTVTMLSGLLSSHNGCKAKETRTRGRPAVDTCLMHQNAPGPATSRRLLGRLGRQNRGSKALHGPAPTSDQCRVSSSDERRERKASSSVVVEDHS